MPGPLTLETLRKAVAGSAAAFRCVTEYQPAGGPGDKVFPPTYEGGKYATEKRYVPDPQNPGDPSRARVADCVLLDSVQSQANRMELALLDAWEAGRIELPVIVVDFNNERLEKRLRVTSLDAPHRIADAILRDSYDGNGKGRKRFRQSERGKRLDAVGLRNATPLLKMCPTALVFGLWDSTGPKGGLGAKVQRALVSEIVGYDAVPGVKPASRIDPLAIEKDAGPLFRTAEGGWTPNLANAVQDATKGYLLYKQNSKKQDVWWKPPPDRPDWPWGNVPDEGRPSTANHGNVTPTIEDGGFTISKAVQTTTLSLPALRRLHFPTDAGGRPSTEAERKKQEAINVAARTALAALGLCAATLAREAGCDLRSRCLLVPKDGDQFDWELIGVGKTESFGLSGEAAIKLLTDAVGALRKEIKTAWPREPVNLTPSDELLELVVRSQKLAAASKGETGAEG